MSCDEECVCVYPPFQEASFRGSCSLRYYCIVRYWRHYLCCGLEWNINIYLEVLLYNNGTQKRFQIHRLVAICFLENKENKPCVNHLDGNPSNNKLTNLEWVTYSENEKHSFNVLGKVSSGILRRKINLKDIEKIKDLSLKGLSHRNISKIYNVSHNTIGNILRCQTYVKHI